MSKKLEGKVALITGASLGIGAAIAERLADDGAAVVVNYGRSKDAADKLVARIESKGGRAVAIQADLRNLAELRSLFQKTIEAFGKLDILVNNAGVYEFKPLEAVDESHFDNQFALNVKGLLFASQEAAKAFGSNGGSIINISSIVATLAPENGSVYSATKGAVDVITKSLATELGPRKIFVNSVSPGAIETEGFHAMEGSENFRGHVIAKTPLGRIGVPEDISNVVAFLAGPDSGWITGQVIPVAGGFRS